MDGILEFFVSVMAGIVSYYVCAFLDRYRKDR